MREERVPQAGQLADTAAAFTVSTMTSSCREMLSRRRADGSGSKTGRGLDKAAICPFRLKHSRPNLFYAESVHQKCGRPFQLIIYGRFWVFTEGAGRG